MRTPTGVVGVVINYYAGDDVTVVRRFCDGTLEACHASKLRRIYEGELHACQSKTITYGTCFPCGD